ncbi:MAG TPA: ribonuclease H-like domain-containing protein [Bacteroidales bacterium]|nr:ribonuclease H-like domain-containing protein [Bacteroidales bacterium]
MLKNINIENILFLDIETVPRWEHYADMPENFQQLWAHKSQFISGAKELSPEEVFDRAGIYSEFGKIICISVAFVRGGGIKVKSFFGDDEKKLLKEFAMLLSQYYNKEQHNLCAHNGKEFDFPYIVRRMLVNGVDVPDILDVAAKKPWEVKLMDTMELWKFGDYKNYTSLELLSALFDIPSPKDDIKGSEVAGVYWKEKDLGRIVRYCQKDVVTIVQLFRRYQNTPLIADAFIVMI